MTKKQQLSHIMAYFLMISATYMGVTTALTGDVPYRMEVSMYVNTILDGN